MAGWSVEGVGEGGELGLGQLRRGIWGSLVLCFPSGGT